MADLRISELPVLAEADLQANDDLPIVDYSAAETKRLTAKALVEKGVKLIDDDSIPGGKIVGDSVTSEEIGPDAVTSSELADNAVDTAAIQASAVTTAKINDDAVTQAKIATDAVGVDQIEADAVRSSEIQDNAVIESKILNSAVTTNKINDDAVTGAKLGAVTNRGLDQTGDMIGITNSVTAGDLAGISFDSQGLITSAAAIIPSADLPPATSSDIGAIKPGPGLSVEGDGTLNLGGQGMSIQNILQIGGMTFQFGLCTEVPTGAPATFDRDAIALAGVNPGDTGAVYVPVGDDVGLEINTSSGELTHEQSSVTAGTYASVTVDANGHITSGTTQISEEQLPSELPAQDISIAGGHMPTIPATTEQGFTKEVVTQAIADQSIGRRHFNDISISYIQEEQPTSTAQPGSDATVFRGMLWLRPSTGTLYMYSGNNWIIVAGGKLAQENLRYCGNIDASTGNITALTDEGAAEQLEGGGSAFVVGDPLPAADDKISGAYFLVIKAGTGIGVVDVSGNSFQVGDLCVALSKATGWTQVSGAFGGGGGGGGGLWVRTGAVPTAILTPDNVADNVDLSGSDFMRLPSSATGDAPVDSVAGSFRWQSVNGALEVYTGAAWQQLDHIDCGEY